MNDGAILLQREMNGPFGLLSRHTSTTQTKDELDTNVPFWLLVAAGSSDIDGQLLEGIRLAFETRSPLLAGFFMVPCAACGPEFPRLAESPRPPPLR